MSDSKPAILKIAPNRIHEAEETAEREEIGKAKPKSLPSDMTHSNGDSGGSSLPSKSALTKGGTKVKTPVKKKKPKPPPPPRGRP